jgi:hypothetical protein
VDRQSILSILKSQLDPVHATMVYRLDPAELDELLPLEIVPFPRRTVRVALVVVKNADPDLASEIDRLIVQLGDPKWSTREQAHASLLKFGPAAAPKLREAQQNKDMEIVYRVERLLKTIENSNQ